MKYLVHSDNVLNLSAAICIYKFSATGAKAQYRVRIDFPARPKKEEYYQIAFETVEKQQEFFDWLMLVLNDSRLGVFTETHFNNWKEQKAHGTKEER